MADDLKRTVIHPIHAATPGVRLVEFGGYDMPVQYVEGIMAEHRWTRECAGLFDVSHMGPCFLTLNQRSGDPVADHAAVAAIVETLGPRDIAGMKPGQIRYNVLLNETGGMIDDLMVARPPELNASGTLYIVVNAGGKEHDFSLFEQAAAGIATLRRADDGGLIALQGPKACAVLSALVPGVADLAFMTHASFSLEGSKLLVARSGYTGEDGFEILASATFAPVLWSMLLADARVRPIGLGARDSLRLEAGLPLYGHDADETVSPIEAGLGMAVSPSRRRKADFPGAARINAELSGELSRVRVGLLVEGAPAREGAEIADASGAVIGRVTSGGFSPTLNRPIAMGFVPPAFAAAGTSLSVLVRGRSQAAQVVAMPFVPHNYVRKVLETV